MTSGQVYDGGGTLWIRSGRRDVTIDGPLTGYFGNSS